MPNILVLVSGSVAAIKVPSLCQLLLAAGEGAEWLGSKVAVRVVASASALHFFDRSELPPSVSLYVDAEEWTTWSKMGDPVLHIELRKWADVGLVAPLSANTLAKMAHGLSDNLLSCTLRAWDFHRAPLLVAPAMNTHMWAHPLTGRQLDVLRDVLGIQIVDPVEKVLACKDKGMGAMASVPDIVQCTLQRLRAAAPAGASEHKT